MGLLEERATMEAIVGVAQKLYPGRYPASGRYHPTDLFTDYGLAFAALKLPWWRWRVVYGIPWRPRDLLAAPGHYGRVASAKRLIHETLTRRIGYDVSSIFR